MEDSAKYRDTIRIVGEVKKNYLELTKFFRRTFPRPVNLKNVVTKFVYKVTKVFPFFGLQNQEQTCISLQSGVKTSLITNNACCEAQLRVGPRSFRKFSKPTKTNH